MRSLDDHRHTLHGFAADLDELGNCSISRTVYGCQRLALDHCLARFDADLDADRRIDLIGLFLPPAAELDDAKPTEKPEETKPAKKDKKTKAPKKEEAAESEEEEEQPEEKPAKKEKKSKTPKEAATEEPAEATKAEEKAEAAADKKEEKKAASKVQMIKLPVVNQAPESKAIDDATPVEGSSI